MHARKADGTEQPATASDDDAVLLSFDGAIARLMFNRPSTRNAIDVATAEAFVSACRALSRKPGVRVVIVSAKGAHFGAGGDLAALRHDSAQTAGDIIKRMHEGVRLLSALEAPVVASLQGAVAGGSLSLAMACDLAIAAEGATFNLAYIHVGTSCDVGASWNLPRLVGMRNAMQIALLSESLDAGQALRLGLVNRVVPMSELDAEVELLAQKIAKGPTLAYGRMKCLMRQSFENSLDAQLEAEMKNFQASAATADFAEGVAAFLEKRRPLFSGA